MTLGLTVATLAPSVDRPARAGMGLERIAPGDWLMPLADPAARRTAFEDQLDAIQILPGAEDAAAEAARLLGHATLPEAARAVWEDLCILLPAEDGYRLRAAAVAFPTDWRLDDKMELPLAAIHAPIHGYAERLSEGVDHFFRTLAAGPIFGRSNWFVVPGADWRYLPTDDPAARFAHVTATNAGETLFIRCERQTLRRLPETSAVLFTIGVAVARLDSLPPATVRGIAAGLARLIPGEDERRAAPHYADALAAYAAGLPRLSTAAAA